MNTASGVVYVGGGAIAAAHMNHKTTNVKHKTPSGVLQKYSRANEKKPVAKVAKQVEVGE